MPSSILNSDDGVISGTSGLKSSGGDDGVLVFQSKGTETARINTDKQIVAAAGTASLPALTTTGDVNTGIFFPAADTIAFAEGGAEAMRIDSSGNVGIGTTSPDQKLEVAIGDGDGISIEQTSSGHTGNLWFRDSDGGYAGRISYDHSSDALRFATGTTERARITSNGTLSLQGPHSGVFINSTAAITLASGGTVTITATNAGAVLVMVWNNTEGSGLLCFGSYSGTMEKIAGTGAATDTGSTHAIYKSNDSNTITYKNKYGGTRTNWIAVYSALAIA